MTQVAEVLVKPKLLIIELDYHAEVLLKICRLLKADFELTVLSTERIWRKTGLLESDVHAVALKRQTEGIEEFLARQSHLVAAADLVYFNTLQKYRRFFSRYEFACPTVLRIHNAHAELAPWRNIDWELPNLPKVVGFLLVGVLFKRRWRDKRIIVEKSTRLMLPNSAIAEYVASQGWFVPEKLANYCLPFSYLSGPCPQPSPGRSTVVMAVLGTVSPKRKSYGVLYAALEQARRNFRKPVELLFLGQARGRAGRRIVEEFNGLCTDNFKFSASSGYVPPEEMESIMARVNFLLAPIKTITKFQIQREVYGLTKISGVENDIVSYQKPALMTADYRVPEELSSVCESFADAGDLAVRLERWVNSDVWVEKTASFASLDAYRPQTILARFKQFAGELIVASGSSAR